MDDVVHNKKKMIGSSCMEALTSFAELKTQASILSSLIFEVDAGDGAQFQIHLSGSI